MAMRTRILALSALLVLHGKHARAQKVVIHSVAPTAVLQELSTQLEAQNYTLATSDTKNVVYTRAAPVFGRLPYDHAVDQLTFRFKLTGEGVVVVASEDIVMFVPNGHVWGSMRITEHRDQLQQLLDIVRAQLENEQPASDSTRKHDSTD